MILNAILLFFNNLLYGLFGLLPEADFINTPIVDAIDYILDFADGITWLLPMDTLIQVVILTFVAIEFPIYTYKLGLRIYGMVRGGGGETK